MVDTPEAPEPQVSALGEFVDSLMQAARRDDNMASADYIANGERWVIVVLRPSVAPERLGLPGPYDGPDRDRDPWEPRRAESEPRPWGHNPERTRAAVEWTKRQLGESRDV